MYGRKRSLPAEAVLVVPATFYHGAVVLRAFLYRTGICRSRQLPVRVISVGNITVGGTGKTPAVMAIAALFRRRGMRPVILSRGYGRDDEAAIRIVPSAGGGAADCGDEPALMAEALPDVPVIVGRDRLRSGLLASERFAPDVIILDDGFQHLRLRRDIDIALVDACDPFGNGKLLPAGILREPLPALARADVVILTRADRAQDLGAVRDQVRRHSAARILTARHAPAGLFEISTGKSRQLEDLRHADVFAFTGIARPESLFDTLRTLGAVLKGTAAYPDHHPYRREDLADLVCRSAGCGARMLVTTEKDAVKLKGLAPKDIWAVRIALEVLEPQAWEEVLAGSL